MRARTAVVAVSAGASASRTGGPSRLTASSSTSIDPSVSSAAEGFQRRPTEKRPARGDSHPSNDRTHHGYRSSITDRIRSPRSTTPAGQPGTDPHRPRPRPPRPHTRPGLHLLTRTPAEKPTTQKPCTTLITRLNARPNPPPFSGEPPQMPPPARLLQQQHRQEGVNRPQAHRDPARSRISAALRSQPNQPVGSVKRAALSRSRW